MHLELRLGLEELRVLGVGGSDEVGVGPEVRGKETVSEAKSLEGGLAEVLNGSGLTLGGGVAIINTSELDELLGDGGSDDTGTSGGGDESNSDGSALSSDLDGDGMDVSDLVTPVTSSDGDEVELGINESSLNSKLDFLGELDSETDVSLKVTNGNDGFKSGSLSGLGLLLDGDDLHDLIGKLLVADLEELVNDGAFLDGKSVVVDLFKRLDLSGLYESSELGKGSPFLVVSSSSGASSSSEALLEAASSASSASLASLGRCCCRC